MSLAALAPKGNPKLKGALLEFIAKNNRDAISERLREDTGLAELRPLEKRDLIRAAQATKDHRLILLLAKKLEVTVYLGIPYQPFDEDKPILIVQEPLNTTGDFYHILAYLALAKSLGYLIPKLVLTYEDREGFGTKMPYLRDMAFLDMLDLAEHAADMPVTKLDKLPRPSSNSRRLALREAIKTGKYHIIDQKALTVILAEQCLRFGLDAVSEHIRSILRGRHPRLSKAVLEHIQTFGAKELAAIEASTQPYVVLHIRSATSTATGYNVQQDIDPLFVIALANFLIGKGYNVLFVRSAGNEVVPQTYALSPTDSRVALSPFLPRSQPQRSIFTELPEHVANLLETEHPGVSPITPVDIGKTLQLDLFLRLFDLSQKLAESGRAIHVIGNTSGTTDNIAFLGHRVLNIHRFKATEVTREDYQGYRMLMQLAFMSVVGKASSRDLEKPIADWLTRKQIRPVVDFPATDLGELARGVDRKYIIDFAALCSVMGWPTGRTPNTSAKDGVSVTMLDAATVVFDWLKDRMRQGVDIAAPGAFASFGIEPSSGKTAKPAALPLFTVEGADFIINQGYEYEDQDIQAILGARLAETDYRINDKPVHLMAAADLIVPGQVQQRLEAERLLEDHAGARIVLIPLNLGNLHWVGLLCEFAEDNSLARAELIDSQGGAAHIPPGLNQQLQGVYPDQTFAEREDRLIQDDGTSCGACTIENLLYASGHVESALDAVPTFAGGMVEMRARHLHTLETQRPDFFETFEARQRENHPTFNSLATYSWLSEPKTKVECETLMHLIACVAELEPAIQEPILHALTLPEAEDSSTRSQTHLTQMRSAFFTYREHRAVRELSLTFFGIPQDKEFENEDAFVDACGLQVNYAYLEELSCYLCNPKLLPQTTSPASTPTTPDSTLPLAAFFAATHLADKKEETPEATL